MGMAASQARFLGLTARKSNVEFQGQQINQARTALTNEVMGLYGQYSKLKVPVAPSKYDYVKQTYSISSTYENYQIKNFSKITSGPYQGYYSTMLTCDEEIPRAYTNTFRDTVITALKTTQPASHSKNMDNITLNAKKNDNGDYSYINFTYKDNAYLYDENDMDNTNVAKITGDYENYPGLSDVMLNQGLDPTNNALGKTYYGIMVDGEAYYIDKDNLNDLEYSQVDDKQVYNGSIKTYGEKLQSKESETYSYLNFVLGTSTFTYDANKEENNSITKITGDYSFYPGLSTIMESQGLDPKDTSLDKVYYSFTMNGTTYYVAESDLNDTAFQTEDGKQMYYGDFTFDYQGLQTKSKEVQAIASLTQDSNGRLTSINVLSCDDDKDLEGKIYSITVGQEDDENGYLDAMNKYNYEKDKYEQRLKVLNAKIEKIQTEDKTLEIKLAQLDTEQEALKTEMDSVKQTIDDTIDKLFDSSK